MTIPMTTSPQDSPLGVSNRRRSQLTITSFMSTPTPPIANISVSCIPVPTDASLHSKPNKKIQESYTSVMSTPNQIDTKISVPSATVPTAQLSNSKTNIKTQTSFTCNSYPSASNYNQTSILNFIRPLSTSTPRSITTPVRPTKQYSTGSFFQQLLSSTYPILTLQFSPNTDKITQQHNIKASSKQQKITDFFTKSATRPSCNRHSSSIPNRPTKTSTKTKRQHLLNYSPTVNYPKITSFFIKELPEYELIDTWGHSLPTNLTQGLLVLLMRGAL